MSVTVHSFKSSCLFLVVVVGASNVLILVHPIFFSCKR